MLAPATIGTRMRRTLLVTPLLALTLTACGAAPATQEDKFKEGDQAEIAKLVDDLATAGKSHNAEKICTDILAKQLVDELKSADGDCKEEMNRAISDASDYDLQVDSVKVTGSTATAQVRQGTSKKVATFSFVKEKAGWRASALGSAG
jgi:hypothetical protein